jgi:hypothetical protein
MNIAEQKYLEDQLYKAIPVLPESVGVIRIKIQTHLGATNWLNVDADKYKKIENILRGLDKWP